MLSADADCDGQAEAAARRQNAHGHRVAEIKSGGACRAPDVDDGIGVCLAEVAAENGYRYGSCRSSCETHVCCPCCETCVARDALPHLPLVPHPTAPLSRLASGNPECGGSVSGVRLPGLSRGKAQRRPRNLKAPLLPPLKHSLLKELCRTCVAWETQLHYINTLHYIYNK